MKKIVTCLGVSVLAFAMTSCANDDSFSEKSTEEKLVPLTFYAGEMPAYHAGATAAAAGSATRTVLEADKSVSWKTNDKIGIGYWGAPNNGEARPFTTEMGGASASFSGMAPDKNNGYFVMYPYRATSKIQWNSSIQATYQYAFPATQTAIANTFDPDANFSVGLIPQVKRSFVAYNLAGLLKFSFHGVSNVVKVKLVSRGQESLVGDVKTEAKFSNTDASLQTAPITFDTGKGVPVLTYAPASGTLAENTDYYVVLPAGQFAQGLTLAFILQDGKVFQKKVTNTVEIKRGKIYPLGNITINPTKAKEQILVNKAIIDAVASRVSGLLREPDGTLNIYRAENLEKILSYKGELTITNDASFTSLSELQYYRNITGLRLSNNPNLSGELDLSKFPQLTGRIEIEKSPLVTKVNVKGLDIGILQVHDMPGMTDITIKDNPKLRQVDVRSNAVLKSVDVSNLPSLTQLATYYSPRITTINTTNTPNLTDINATSTSDLVSVIGLEDNTQLDRFWASGSKLTKLDFSHQTRLKSVNLSSSSVNEIKGLAASGGYLENLTLPNIHISTLDVSSNPNLKTLDLYNVPELTSLDLSNNTKLTWLRVALSKNLSSLTLGNNTLLTYLDISHNKFAAFDIRNLTGLTEFYAGSQAPNGFLANIQVTMTAAQKARFDSKGIVFKESANDSQPTREKTNSWVKVIVQ